MAAGLLGALKLVLAVQASQAAVAGTIRDGESADPLVGAVVTLTDVDRATVSDSAGRYRLGAMPPGPQWRAPPRSPRMWTASRSGVPGLPGSRSSSRARRPG